MFTIACYSVYRSADPKLLHFFRSEALRNARFAIGIDIMLVRQVCDNKRSFLRSVLSGLRESMRDLKWYLFMLSRGHIILPLPALISLLGIWSPLGKNLSPPFDTVASLYAAGWPDAHAANEIMATYLRFLVSSDEVYGLKPYDRRFLRLLKRWSIYKKLVDAFFRIFRPKLYLAIHSGYLHHQVPCEAAARYSVPALVLGCNDCLYRVSDYEVPRTFTFIDFKKPSMPRDFLMLAERGSNLLSKRIKGSYDPTIPYMKTSAYEILPAKNFWSYPSVSECLRDIFHDELRPFSDTGFITVFMHELNDWHHNGTLPPFATSYYDWLLKTLAYLQSQKLPYVLKVHPAIVNSPESYPTSVDALTRLSAQLGLRLPVTTSLTTIQLIEVGMRLGVTVRGTIALELAYLQAPFLCAGRPPFAALFPKRVEPDFASYCQRLLNYRNECPVDSEESTRAAYYVALQESITGLPDLDLKGPAPRLSDDECFVKMKTCL